MLVQKFCTNTTLDFHLVLPDATTIFSSKYGDGDRPILLSDLQCSNNESNLLECARGNSYIGYHTCWSLNGNAAAVQCDSKYNIIFCVCDSKYSNLFCECDSNYNNVFCKCDSNYNNVLCKCDGNYNNVVCMCDSKYSNLFCKCDIK